MILILATGKPEQAPKIYQKVVERGGNAAYLFFADYPSKVLLSYNAEDPVEGTLRLADGKTVVSFSEINVAYWPITMGYIPVDKMNAQDAEPQFDVFQDVKSAMDTFIYHLDCYWIDHLETFTRHYAKNYQLRQFKTAGLTVPDTLVTNDIEAVKAFYEKHEKRVVYKPVWSGAGGNYTTMLLDEHFADGRFNHMSATPIVFQEFIPGQDLIVFLLNHETFYAFETQTATIDYRGDENIKYTPITLPDEIQAQCKTLARIQNSNFCLIDVRRTPDGRYVFFEGTPSPDVTKVEMRSGFAISDKLVDMMIEMDRAS